MRETANRIRGASSPLATLIQKDQFVGWVYRIDYENALVLTNDLFKKQASGIPHNCFLSATAFDPDRMSEADEHDLEIVLLRVTNTAALPQDMDDARTKIDHLMRQEAADADAEYDALTLSQLQYGGLQCRVLGTFYMQDGELWLGSDIESFYASAHLRVYRPSGAALERIVNHIDPRRRKQAEDAAKDLGLKKPLAPFRLGTVRYTSTDRLHRASDADLVPVSIQPSDFMARRTALFGMTRTGKSNAVKQIVSVVKRVADDGGIAIGQIIYDINGEYANANRQDKGALAEVYPAGEVVRYRMLDTEGFEPLQNNFYVQLSEGHSLIRRLLRETQPAGSTSGDVEVFLDLSLDEPRGGQFTSEWKRWNVRKAAYQALLHRADFPLPLSFTVKFEANQSVREAVKNADASCTKDPKYGLTLDEAMNWFLAAREADLTSPLTSSSGKEWLDAGSRAILNMMAQRNKNSAFIVGYNVLSGAQQYHSPRRSQEVGREIYDHLAAGKVVILDLSVGSPKIRERISEQIARHLFTESMNRFVSGNKPPEIMVYTEEAHNLIGKGQELDETWPRLAKEGAKYRIGFVYATQEVSSMHPNILANTENWVITHLNNEKEVKQLAAFYDFADFDKSLIRAQDVGFARVKALSGPFVVPVQVDVFDPDNEKQRAQEAAAARKAAEGTADDSIVGDPISSVTAQQTSSGAAADD